MRLTSRKHRDLLFACALLGISLATAGCSSREAPAPRQDEQPFHLVATIQDIMEAQVDPSADVLWDAVTFTSTLEGTEQRQPRTEEEWKAVRRSTIIIIEAANLLSMKGRRAAAANRAVLPGEMGPAEVQRLVDTNHAGFAQFAYAMQSAAVKALAAIDAKDPQALMDAGGVLDETCDACHVVYWHTRQK